MKIKALSLSIFSCILLTACGGSNNSNSSNSSNSTSANDQTNTKIADQAWTSFNIHGDDSKGKLDFEIDQRTIKDGQYYSKIDQTSDNTEYYNLGLFVTADGGYGDGPIHPEYGVQLGSANGSNEKQILSPYSPVGSKGFQITVYYKTIDISGKSISESINPEDIFKIQNNFRTNSISKTLLNFYAKNSSIKLPEGSKCLVLTKSENNQGHLELDKSSKDKKEIIDIWNTEASKNANETIKKLFKDTTAYITDKPDLDSVIAKFQNNFYAGYQIDKGIDYLLTEEIGDMKSLADHENLTAEEKKLKLESIDLLNTTCTYFNETASKTIRDSIKNIK
ncbi:MAG: hypothetical protein H9855_06540 [Candidatus Acinetobacter avistercoris]|uniref:hypothetical protein n=1 Tax=Acinetobacter sp. KS-LM10 TaxID=3120518 RepID=UPI001FA650F1|nr:hypothetical protein [Candidatus Acinetobacter avistercoris]